MFVFFKVVQPLYILSWALIISDWCGLSIQILLVLRLLWYIFSAFSIDYDATITHFYSRYFY